MKRNPPLGTPWTRDGWIDGGKAVPALDLHLNVMEGGRGSKTCQKAPPGPPLASSSKQAMSLEERIKTKSYQELTSREEMLMLGKMLVSYRICEYLKYLLAPLWPIVAFILFLYLVWRCA